MLSAFSNLYCSMLSGVFIRLVNGIFLCVSFGYDSLKDKTKYSVRRAVMIFPFVYTVVLSLCDHFFRYDYSLLAPLFVLSSAIFTFAYFYLANNQWDFDRCSYFFMFSVLLQIIKEFSNVLSFEVVQHTCDVFRLPDSMMANFIYDLVVASVNAMVLLLFHRSGFIAQKVVRALSLHWEFPLVLILCLCSTAYVKQLAVTQQLDLTNLGVSPYLHILLFILPTYLFFYKITTKYTNIRCENKNYRIEKQPLNWILHQEGTSCPAISTARGSLSALGKYQFLTKGFIKNLRKLDIDYSCEGFVELVFSMFLTYMCMGTRYIDYKKDVFDVVEEVFELPKDCDFVKNRIAKIIRKSWATVEREIWEKEYFDECFMNVINGKKCAPNVNEFLFNMVRKNKLSIDELISSKECIGDMISRHAGLISIDGEGVLITGESGIGKSEVAWELLNQGCCLVADDVVEIRRIGNNLYGNGCKETKDFMEARGLGIVNVRGMFGSRAVKDVERIDLIVNLVKCENTLNSSSDLVGSSVCYAEIMGVLVPYVTISVRSEKSVANLVKIAAMNNRRRFLGFVASEELFKNLGMESGSNGDSSIITESKVFDY